MVAAPSRAFAAVVVVFSMAWSMAWAQQSGQSGGPVTDALRAAFVPRVPLTERFERLRAEVSSRFPFSVVAQLQAWQTPAVDVGEGAFNALSGRYGAIPVDMSWMMPIAAFIRTGMGLVILVATVWWILNRVTPVLKI